LLDRDDADKYYLVDNFQPWSCNVEILQDVRSYPLKSYSVLLFCSIQVFSTAIPSTQLVISTIILFIEMRVKHTTQLYSYIGDREKTLAGLKSVA